MSSELWIILVLTLVALNGVLVGTFLVLRGKAMLTDAMSHGVLFGIAVFALLTGTISGFWMIVGGTLACLLTAYLSQYLQEKGRIQDDVSIGISFTWLFAVGVILIALFANKVHIDEDCVLLGEIVFVPFDMVSFGGKEIAPRAFISLFFVFILNILLVTFGWRGLNASSFDLVQSKLTNLHPERWSFLLLLSASLTTVTSFEAVGVILIVSLIVTPAATAYLLSRTTWQMILYALLFAILSVFSGYLLADEYDASISASVAMMSGIYFFIVFMISLMNSNQEEVLESLPSEG